MEIVELNQSQKHELETFKANVWPEADREHYGEENLNFFKKECTFLAKENGEVVGYISLVIDTGVAQIEPLMVKKEMRGQGIGAMLLLKAEAYAKDHHVHKIWLETGSEWSAKSFYEKHGYQIRSLLPHHTHGQEFVLMDKML